MGRPKTGKKGGITGQACGDIEPGGFVRRDFDKGMERIKR